MKSKMKIDLWIGVLLLGSVLMFIPIIFTVPQNERLIMVLVSLGMAIIILPFFYGYHELTDEAVVTRIGFIKQTIPYERIKEVRLCSNWLSSMAMTRKRIEIKEHNKGFLRGTTYIGPVNRDEFFEELKRHCYNLEEKIDISEF